MSEIMEGSTVTLMLADYRVVVNGEPVELMTSALTLAASSLCGSPESEALILLARAFSASKNVVLNIPMDRSYHETGRWTTANRDLVCKLEDYGAEVL
jgi:hypothetical protein